MKPIRTLEEAKALADAAARRLRQRAEQTVDRRRQREWSASKLSRWMAQRTRSAV